MKTTTKKVETKKEEVKKDMKEICILWEHTTDSDVTYLSGNLSEELGYKKLIAFYNFPKQNEKAPDINVFTLDDENKRDAKVISLWNQTSKQGIKYLSGLTNENENVVGFFNSSDDTKQPKIKVYLKESN